MTKFESWDLVSYRLVYRRAVSFLFAPQSTFASVRAWCVVWERHGLSGIATVTKDCGFLFLGIWLTGDLINHKAESFWHLLRLKQDVHSCLFHSISSKYEKMISSRSTWTEALQHTFMTHLRSHKSLLLFGFCQTEKGQSTSFLMYLQSYIDMFLVKKFSKTCFRVKMFQSKSYPICSGSNS